MQLFGSLFSTSITEWYARETYLVRGSPIMYYVEEQDIDCVCCCDINFNKIETFLSSQWIVNYWTSWHFVITKWHYSEILQLFFIKISFSNYVTGAFQSDIIIKKPGKGNYRQYQRYLPTLRLAHRKKLNYRQF